MWHWYGYNPSNVTLGKRDRARQGTERGRGARGTRAPLKIPYPAHDSKAAGLMAAVSRRRRRGWPGEHRRVEESVADVVIGAGIAPQNHRRGGLRRVLDLAGDDLAGDELAGDELAGDPRAAARQRALLSRGQDADAAGQDLAGRGGWRAARFPIGPAAQERPRRRRRVPAGNEADAQWPRRCPCRRSPHGHDGVRELEEPLSGPAPGAARTPGQCH
jgi:hypothetical protein